MRSKSAIISLDGDDNVCGALVDLVDGCQSIAWHVHVGVCQVVGNQGRRQDT